MEQFASQDPRVYSLYFDLKYLIAGPESYRDFENGP